MCASDVVQFLEMIGRGDAVEAVLGAYAKGLRNTYYISLAMAGGPFLVSWGFVWKRIRESGEGEIEVQDAEAVEGETAGSDTTRVETRAT